VLFRRRGDDAALRINDEGARAAGADVNTKNVDKASSRAGKARRTSYMEKGEREKSRRICKKGRTVPRPGESRL
jgi:hypothetical protein